MSFSPSLTHKFFSIFIFIFPLIAQAIVPPSNTFKFINQGEFGDYITDYGASYRVLDIFTFPFTLCFYNTTPNAFTLALRMGSPRSESTLRWVWDANRGNPVHENATLTFGSNGNLVLADSDGRVAWQTGTANKGIVGLKLLPNGNLVLHDSKGKYIWQSFDYPSDTLLVDQIVRPNGPNQLVSRVSNVDGSAGPYSLVLEKTRLALFLKSKNSPKPLLYHTFTEESSITQIAFKSTPETSAGHAYDLAFEINMAGSLFLGRPKYNSTLSMLRLGSDGNVKIYTYNDKVDIGAWEVTYILFDRNWRESECKLPKRCGSLGICEDDQCVACPRPKGLFGWTKDCAPPVLPPCNGKANFDYYKVVGVEHFMNGYTEGDGPMKLVECREKCNKDCGCLGFFYREKSSKCLLAPELDTLIKVSNLSNVAYIKMSK